MKKRDEPSAGDDPVRCIEYLEGGVPSKVIELISRVDARDGKATSSRRGLRHVLELIKAVCDAYLSSKLDKDFRKRAEALLLRFAPLMPDVRRICKRVDPQIETAITGINSAAQEGNHQ